MYVYHYITILYKMSYNIQKKEKKKKKVLEYFMWCGSH